MSNLKHIESKKDYDELIHSGRPVLIDFYADWCGPCRMLSPIIEEVAEANPDSTLIIAKANVDEQNEIAAENRIQSIPALIIFKDGQNVWEHHGYMDKNSLVSKLREWDSNIKF